MTAAAKLDLDALAPLVMSIRPAPRICLNDGSEAGGGPICDWYCTSDLTKCEECPGPMDECEHRAYMIEWDAARARWRAEDEAGAGNQETR